jgi:hypothetical protein
MQISKETQAQRQLIAKARTRLVEMMYSDETPEEDRLTQAEWLFVLSDVAHDMIARKLRYVHKGREPKESLE